MVWRLLIAVVVAVSYVAVAVTDATAQRRPANYDQTVTGNDPVANFFGFGGGSSGGARQLRARPSASPTITGLARS